MPAAFAHACFLPVRSPTPRSRSPCSRKVRSRTPAKSCRRPSAASPRASRRCRERSCSTTPREAATRSPSSAATPTRASPSTRPRRREVGHLERREELRREVRREQHFVDGLLRRGRVDGEARVGVAACRRAVVAGVRGEVEQLLVRQRLEARGEAADGRRHVYVCGLFGCGLVARCVGDRHRGQEPKPLRATSPPVCRALRRYSPLHRRGVPLSPHK